MPIGDRPAEPLNDHEVQALIAATGTTLIGLRSKALIVIMWRGGLRCGEALALRDADIDMRGGTIRILHGKGAKARTVGIDYQAIEVIQTWINARDRRIAPSSALLCTMTGEPMCDRYIRDLMPRLGRKAGISKRVHAHGLRHTHACELAAEGVPVNVISRQLGHSAAP